ncbi:hypothetical protein [Rhizobium sp. ZX09]|uniref:hypothetical protein n=1 Tax=Rhizobium sp. ZX09 TaxID=2291939 RepID=UPI001A9975EE|nr:hypothetical protein [Rhizobium sp. ZX09]QSZ56684.1 hypothetical protein BTN45_05860 [Rhizobium sp. ZX09]
MRDEDRAYNRQELDEARTYNRQQLDEARAYSRQALTHLVEDSQNAGFNPLTVLRGGGATSYNAGAGFAPLSSASLVSPSVGGGSTPTFTPPARRAVNSGGSGFGDAISSVGDFLSNFDPMADDRREQEYRLVESQIAALNASALSGVRYGQGSYATGNTDRRPSSVGAALGKPSLWTAGDVNVTNPFKTEPVNANWSDAATWEQRYGEPGSWVGGAVVGAADAWDYANRKASAFTKPGGAIRNAARWVDKLLGTEKSKKSGRLSIGSTGGGGGW